MWSVFLNVYSNGCRLEGSLIRSVLVVEEAAIVLWTEDGDGYAGQQISWEARFFETHRFSLIWSQCIVMHCGRTTMHNTCCVSMELAYSKFVFSSSMDSCAFCVLPHKMETKSVYYLVHLHSTAAHSWLCVCSCAGRPPCSTVESCHPVTCHNHDDRLLEADAPPSLEGGPSEV